MLTIQQFETIVNGENRSFIFFMGYAQLFKRFLVQLVRNPTIFLGKLQNG